MMHRARQYWAAFSILTIWAAPSAAQAAETKFLELVEDMPLMRGLTEVADDALMFDKAEGRIVKAVAEGGLTAEQIRAFYVDTLPQLGWQRLPDTGQAALVFERESERLEIAMQYGGLANTVVLFTIAPR
jgi:hypothetical protein